MADILGLARRWRREPGDRGLPLRNEENGETNKVQSRFARRNPRRGVHEAKRCQSEPTRARYRRDDAVGTGRNSPGRRILALDLGLLIWYRSLAGGCQSVQRAPSQGLS